MLYQLSYRLLGGITDNAPEGPATVRLP